MVKLFVGNLAEGVDSSRLRNLFLQYVQVQECDVLKNFAFVVSVLYSYSNHSFHDKLFILARCN